MSCLTPEGAVSGDCDFLSANMYARSLFGEWSPRVSRQASLTLNITRRGCPGEPERGADRDRHYHWSRSDTEQDAGYRAILGRPDHDGYVLPYCQVPARCADSRRILQLKKKTSLQHRLEVDTDDLVYLSAGRYWTFLCSSLFSGEEARHSRGAPRQERKERVGEG